MLGQAKFLPIGTGKSAAEKYKTARGKKYPAVGKSKTAAGWNKTAAGKDNGRIYHRNVTQTLKHPGNGYRR